MKKAVIAVCMLGLAASLQAQEVTLRHDLSGRNLETLTGLVDRFNATQKGKVKGKVLLQSLQSGESANSAAQMPHMALLDTHDDRTFFGATPKYKPLYQLMKETGQKFNVSGMYPQITDAVSEKPGQLQSLPLGLSIPVIYWNKEAFRKAKLNPDIAPRTWHELQNAAGALSEAGFSCPYTTSKFSWVHLENVTTQQGQPVLGQGNRVAMNGLINVKHMAMLATWYRSAYFRYYGAHTEADDRFLSGECAMLTGESSLYADIYSGGKIKAGVGALPYYDDEYGASPGAVSPDGAGLWMLAGKSKAENQVMARFAAFMLQTDVQRDWVKGTGYLPMTAQAITALRESGVHSVVLDAAERRLSMRTDKSRVKNYAQRNRIRDSVSDQAELLWSDKVTAKRALDTAMLSANAAAVVTKKVVRE